MENFKKLKLILASVSILICLMMLHISTTPNSILNIDNFISTAKADMKPCSDKRCDFRNGEDYGCRIDSINMDCDYTGGTCTGYDPC